jgi:hypothetical protein
MDALVQLALVTKCRKVFEHENTFLSFPMSPFSYPKDRLKFAVDGSSTPALLRAASEFARVANSVPRGALFQPDAEEFLWTIYGEVLARARVAGGTLTPDQQQARDDAMALLYVPTADGLRQESPQARAYKQYRDAWIKAREEYRHAQSSAEESNDAAKLSQWRDTDEPALRTRISEVERDWDGLGFRSEVEAAQRTMETIARNAPLTQWSEWKKGYNPDIDVLTDPENQTFAITGFAPNDIFDQDDWTKFRLERAEIVALAEEAPSEVKNLFQPLPPAPQVQSMSFEFRSVGVVRPWFNADIFRARFWRMDDDRPLSDGAAPPRGRCPAYVIALVFARNITVTSLAAPGAPKGRPQLIFAPAQIGSAPALNVKAGAAKAATPTAAQKQLNATAMARLASASFQSIPLTAQGAVRPPVSAAAPQVAMAAVARPGAIKAMPMMAQAVRVAAPPARKGAAPAMKPPPPPQKPAAPAMKPPPPPRRPPPPLQKGAPPARPVPRPAAPPPRQAPPPPPRPAPPPQPPQPTTTAETPPGTIAVLALICRQVPAPCPDPDPGFDWT